MFLKGNHFISCKDCRQNKILSFSLPRCNWPWRTNVTKNFKLKSMLQSTFLPVSLPFLFGYNFIKRNSWPVLSHMVLPHLNTGLFLFYSMNRFMMDVTWYYGKYIQKTQTRNIFVYLSQSSRFKSFNLWIYFKLHITFRRAGQMFIVSFFNRNRWSNSSCLVKGI